MGRCGNRPYRLQGRALLILAVFAAFLSQRALAWNETGHRTVAELAWRQMTPAQRNAASDLLKQHPHYKEMLSAHIPEGVEKDEWVFLTAAVWPDRVRPAKHGQPARPESITKFDLYPHAIGHPFLRPGDTNQALIDNFHISKPNAEMVLSNSLATLRDAKASAHDRAVSLCWVLHLFGDLHQPLHAASLVTAEKPRGDGLGGDYIVLDPRNPPKDRRVTLHEFWDRLLGVNTSYRFISERADEIATAPELKASALSEYQTNKTITTWVQESYRAAVNIAYAEDRVQYAHLDDLKAKKIAETDIPTLKAEYIAEAQNIARHRVALTALRLTDELHRTWP